VYETSIGAWEDMPDDSMRGRDATEAQLRCVMRGVLSRLRSRGWKITHDPQVAKNHPITASRYYVGEKGELKFKANASGRTCEFEFHQEINTENRHGGAYDYNKFTRMMPRHLRIRCIVEMAAVLQKLLEYGYDRPTWHTGPSLAWDLLLHLENRIKKTPLERFNNQWCFKTRNALQPRFERDETGWPTPKEYWHCGHPSKDRYGVLLKPGDEVYYRNRKGRLLRGRAYPDMNDGWLVESAVGIDHLQRKAIFRCERPDLEPRRLVPGQLERLHKEAEKALKTKDYNRLEALARTIERIRTRSN